MKPIKDARDTSLGRIIRERADEVDRALGGTSEGERQAGAVAGEVDRVDASPQSALTGAVAHKIRDIEAALRELSSHGYTQAQIDQLLDSLPSAVRRARAVIVAEDASLFAHRTAIDAYRTVLREFDARLEAVLPIPARYDDAVRQLRNDLRDQEPSGAQGRAFNARVHAFWPNAPRRFLLADPDGPVSGESKTIAELKTAADVLTDNLDRESGLERYVLPSDPEFLSAKKALLLVGAHLSSHALPTESEVAALRQSVVEAIRSARERGEEHAALRGLRGNIEELVLDAEKLIGDSGVKRERMRSESAAQGEYEGSVRLHGTTNAADSRRTLGITTSRSTRSSFESRGSERGSFRSHTEGYTEIPNWGARQYAFDVSPVEIHEPPLSRGVTPQELPWILEKLLTARRIYEVMRAETPTSAEVASLERWMDDSTLEITHRRRPKSAETFSLNLGSLRADMVPLAESGLYPTERVAILERERTAPTASGRPALSGLDAFGGAQDVRSKPLLDAIVGEAGARRRDREKDIEDAIASSPTPDREAVDKSARAELKARLLTRFCDRLAQAQKALAAHYVVGNYEIRELTASIGPLASIAMIEEKPDLAAAIEGFERLVRSPTFITAQENVNRLHRNDLARVVTSRAAQIDAALRSGGESTLPSTFSEDVAREGAKAVIEFAKSLNRERMVATFLNLSDMSANNARWALQTSRALLDGFDPELAARIGQRMDALWDADFAWSVRKDIHAALDEIHAALSRARA